MLITVIEAITSARLIRFLHQFQMSRKELFTLKSKVCRKKLRLNVNLFAVYSFVTGTPIYSNSSQSIFHGYIGGFANISCKFDSLTPTVIKFFRKGNQTVNNKISTIFNSTNFSVLQVRYYLFINKLHLLER